MMVAQFCFFLALLASPFKSSSRLEAENAAVPSENFIHVRNLMIFRRNGAGNH
jgi:hypothetical protein